MREKFRNVEFGRCPRVLCAGQACLPAGPSDVHAANTVKIFCPKCEDLYFPRSKYHVHIDGAFFGTTFPHLFLMTYGSLKPAKPDTAYVPRIFGFRVAAPIEGAPAPAAAAAAATVAATAATAAAAAAAAAAGTRNRAAAGGGSSLMSA
jgi:hypothetical protein